MSHKKENDASRTVSQTDRLQWETAGETGLQDGELGVEITPEELGVARMRDLVKTREASLHREGVRKFDPEI